MVHCVLCKRLLAKKRKKRLVLIDSKGHRHDVCEGCFNDKWSKITRSRKR